jgi:excisionase family DNA binding protein
MKRAKVEATVSTVRDGQVFWTVDETAEFLRSSRVSVYRWIAQGRLKKFKVGNRTLLRREDVHALVSEASARETTTAA